MAHQNKKKTFLLNANFFCLFDKRCWHEFQSPCGSNHQWAHNHLMLFAWWRHQNRDISVCFNADCLCLFVKLLLTWISMFLWKKPRWCLFLDDVARIGKFLFVWILIASIYLKNWCWHEFQGFCESKNVKERSSLWALGWNNHLRVDRHVDGYYSVMCHQNREISVCLKLNSPVYLKNYCGHEFSKFPCKQTFMNLSSRWCLLSDD